MGANANPNPSGNQDGAHGGPGPSSSVQGGGGGGGGGGAAANGNPRNGCVAAAVGNSATAQALKHNPGISLEWSAEEQAMLEKRLNEYASLSSVVRYAKIAMELETKTVRDVALRCRWMNKKESGKRRKEDHNLARKNKDKKEKSADPSAKPSSSHLSGRPNVPPYSLPTISMEDDDISVEAIGGATGKLLQRNTEVLNQISTNIKTMQVQDNISLFCQIRDNLATIFNEIKDVPDIMNQMPPIPVKINEELANSMLPTTPSPMQS
ncbi:hypothetical protein ACMD2_16594 [Ananas comosus]|uniref:Myb-like domain-containing protein n=1 Tax=Ananas comosus TaxID=4615 RepID=A0A199W159_ANACO|nr:hypothetical protein ACMD2_16594 [Ananas comosus]